MVEIMKLALLCRYLIVMQAVSDFSDYIIIIMLSQLIPLPTLQCHVDEASNCLKTCNGTTHTHTHAHASTLSIIFILTYIHLNTHHPRTHSHTHSVIHKFAYTKINQRHSNGIATQRILVGCVLNLRSKLTRSTTLGSLPALSVSQIPNHSLLSCLGH